MEQINQGNDAVQQSKVAKAGKYTSAEKQPTSLLGKIRALPSDLQGQVLALAGARVIVQSGWVFLMFSGSDLLLRLTNGDQSRAVTITTYLDSFNTLVDFVLSPLLGGLVDRYGRRPFILAAPFVSAATRLYLAQRPSVAFYVFYRIVTNLAQIPFGHALVGMNTDLVGRGTELSILIARRVGIVATCVRMVMGQINRNVRSPEFNFQCAAGFNLAAFLVS
jgi:MFS family permease